MNFSVITLILLHFVINVNSKEENYEESCNNFYEDYSCEMFHSRGLCEMFRKHCRLTCGVCQRPTTTPKPTRTTRPSPTPRPNGQWSSCSKSCGGGTRFKLVSRKCTNPNNHRCLREFQECNTYPCRYKICRNNQLKRYGFNKGCCKRRGPAINKNLAILKSVKKAKSFNRKQWPWMALITSPKKVCSGVLIHSQWVMTAAHCVTNGRSKPSTQRVYVYVGINDLEDATSRHRNKIRRINPHPRYKNMQNDIALLQLSGPVRLRYISILSLPRNEITPLDSTCVVVGWGIHHPLPVFGSSNPLEQFDQQVFDLNVCRRKYYNDGILGKYVMKRSPHLLCAGSLTDRNRICEGYGGSPLVCQRCSSCAWYIAGITSSKVTCEKFSYPNLFTKIRAYEDWICKIIPDLNQSPVTCPYKYGP